MPIVLWGVAGLLGLAGWGLKDAQEETARGVADALRIAVPIAAVGAALWLYQKGAK